MLPSPPSSTPFMLHFTDNYDYIIGILEKFHTMTYVFEALIHILLNSFSLVIYTKELLEFRSLDIEKKT